MAGGTVLDRSVLAGLLDGSFVGLDVQASLPSTSQAAREMAPRLGLPCLVACADQTAGHGRLGRGWLSAPGCSLTFTIAVAPTRAVLAGLSLAAAAAVAAALSAHGHEVRLKWPNDLLAVDGGKLGGILVEATPVLLLIGIGLNLAPFPALRERLPYARWLADGPGGIDANALLAACAGAALNVAQGWDADGFAAHRDAWLARCAHAPGDWLQVSAGAGTLTLDYAGIDDAGRLLGTDARGRGHVVTSGEVHVVAGD